MSTLSHSPASIVAHYLVAQDVGGFKTNVTRTEPAWLVSIGGMPNSPDSAISVADSPAFKDEGKLMNGVYIQHPGVQVRCRDLDREVAYAKLETIRGLLQSLRREEITIDETTFLIVNLSIRSPVVFIGNDPDTERPNFVLDMFATVKEL